MKTRRILCRTEVLLQPEDPEEEGVGTQKTIVWLMIVRTIYGGIEGAKVRMFLKMKAWAMIVRGDEGVILGLIVLFMEAIL